MILENIIIIIICIILSICLILFINRDKINFNCCKPKINKYDLPPMDILRDKYKNNSLEENIKLIKNMEDQNKEIELL
jgi:hypothetical protein